MKKNFAKSRWKQAYNASAVIRQLRKLGKLHYKFINLSFKVISIPINLLTLFFLNLALTTTTNSSTINTNTPLSTMTAQQPNSTIPVQTLQQTIQNVQQHQQQVLNKLATNQPQQATSDSNNNDNSMDVATSSNCSKSSFIKQQQDNRLNSTVTNL